MTTNYDALTLVAAGTGWRRYDDGTQVFEVGCRVWTMTEDFGEAVVAEFVDEGNAEGRVRVNYVNGDKALWWDAEMVRAIEDKSDYQMAQERKVQAIVEDRVQSELDNRYAADALPKESQDDVILKAISKTMFRNVEEQMMEAFTKRLMPEVCDKVSEEIAANLSIDEDDIYERVVEGICTDRIAESAAESIAENTDTSDLAEYFCTDEIAEHIQLDDLAEHIDINKLAEQMRQHCDDWLKATSKIELTQELVEVNEKERVQMEALMEADRDRIDELEAAVSVLQDAVELLTNRQPFYVRAWRRVVSLFRKA